MDQNPNQTSPEESRRSTRDAWDEVGRQFQALGESLSMAFRTAWQDEETRTRFVEMRAGIENMINQVGDAIRDTASSPEGVKARQEAARTVDNLRSAGEQTMADVRPHLVSALRQVNDELQKMINRMDETRAARAQEDTKSTDDDPMI